MRPQETDHTFEIRLKIRRMKKKKRKKSESNLKQICYCFAEESQEGLDNINRESF